MKPRRRASSFKGYQVVLAPESATTDEDPLVRQEQSRVNDVQRYANGGPKPSGYDRYEVDPRLADVWFRRMAVAASAVQWRAMMLGMLKDASALQVQNGLRAAMEVQNRLFGKPIERLAMVGRVRIEFGSHLNPDVFPKEAPVQAAEIVEIPTDFGTEIEGLELENEEGT